MYNETIERFRALIAQRTGLHCERGKYDDLSDLLRNRILETGETDAEGYFRLLQSARAQAEWRKLAGQLTVSETYFFRNSDHFRALEAGIIPGLIRKCYRKPSIRILSAGCASGEEAYSIAILLAERFPALQAGDYQITGIDINPLMIERAVRGRYSEWSLREAGAAQRSRYFKQEGHDNQLCDEIRNRASFHERNLIDEDPVFWHTDAFDVIFCRNVTMYLSAAHTRAIIERFSRVLSPEGFLFLGHAETLRGISGDFHLCHTHDTFYYQRRNSMKSHERPEWEAPRELPAAPVLSDDISWVEAIQRASDRIENLCSTQAADAVVAQVPRETPPRSSSRFEEALAFMKQERFSDALESLATETAPENPDAAILRGVLLTNAGRLDEAESICRQLLMRDELNAGAHYLMALCREHAADYACAAEHDHTAIYLEPTFAMAHLHLGLQTKRNGKYFEACQELKQAIDLLSREDPARIIMFGGGFSRESLIGMARTELRSCEAKV